MSEPRIDALHPLIDLGLKPPVHLSPRYLRLLRSARDPRLHFLAEFGHLIAETLLIVSPGCKLLVGLLHLIPDRIHDFLYAGKLGQRHFVTAQRLVGVPAATG